MPDESFAVRRKIGFEWSYDGCEHAADALSHGSSLIEHPGSRIQRRVVVAVVSAAIDRRKAITTHPPRRAGYAVAKAAEGEDIDRTIYMQLVGQS
jgi:hypothetical protein